MGLYSKTLERHLAAVEEAMPHYLPSSKGDGDVAVGAMHYACAVGGKRLRPVLTMEFCRICCGDAVRALPFACGVEMIHSYSLVHDDLPCMDDSPLRRGKPSVHAAYGENMALLAGDALLTRAFEVMLDPEVIGPVPAAQALQAAHTLAAAAGIGGMVGGQFIDLRSENQRIGLEELEELQEGKTAALIAAACAMGCIAAGAGSDKVEAAKTYGRCLGLAFQIVDDILDVTADAATLGKPTGSDAENGKTTYVSLLGLEKARRLAARRTDEAVQALPVFGEEASDLRALADALLRRNK